MTSGMTGFDPELVHNCISQEQKAYETIIGALGDNMQSSFVDKMGTLWACNQAQTFFNSSFKPAIDETIKSCTKTFESVINSINSAGQAWAQQTDSSYSPQSFNAISKTIDTSVIQENIGGIRGIDLEAATATVTGLAAVQTALGTALALAKSAVQNSGFIGQNQAESLISSLNTISNRINELFSETREVINDYMQNTTTAYGDTGTRIAEAFTISG